jgi:DNA polymerase III subunit alpha, Gram-positive type
LSKDKFSLFIEQSKFSSPVLQQAILSNVYVNQKAKKWTFNIVLSEVIGPETLFPFINNIKTYFLVSKVVSMIDVSIQYKSREAFKNFAMDYFDHAVIELSKIKARYLVLKNFEARYEKDTYIISVDQDSTYLDEYLPELKAILNVLGFPVQARLEVIHTLTPTSKMIESSIVEQEKALEQKTVYAKQNVKKEDKKVFTRKSSPQAIAIKEIPLDNMKLDLYKNEKGDTNFLIEGVVSKTEIKQLTNMSLLSFVLGDDDDAIYVKRFIKNEKDKLLAESVHDGDLIQVEGKANFDTYLKDVVIFADAVSFIEKSKKEERIDRAKDKRIEFHVHTKMSNMDAVTDATEYIEQAIKWGHEAIAFTDHNGLYAYPEIYKASQKKDIKPIYGVELDFVDEVNFRITTDTEREILLKDATYVVFDIETTGLSNTRDKIIEIGAVKIEGGAITERYQSFINPGETLSTFTTELTDITDDMLANAPTIEEELPHFLKFIKGSILVAHNALFDIGHIKENAKQDLPFDDSLVIDTIQIARYFFNQDLKRFNLKAVAKFFKVKQEQHHRAEDDAYVTAQIWLSC